MARGGYIKLYRQLLDWGWYGDTNTFRVFMHLLLTATYEDTELMGVKVPRGSAVCSLPGIASAVNLSIKNVRTAMEHLKTTGEVAVTHYPKFSVVELKNYDKYQSDDSQSGSQAAGKRQSSDSQVTPLKNIKNKRKKESNNINCNFDLEKAAHMAACGELKVNKKGAS